MTFDLDIILRHIENNPASMEMSIKDLTFTTITLISIVLPQRMNELARMSLDYITLSDSWANFTIPGRSKNATAAHKFHRMHISQYTNPNLCPLTTLAIYLKRTEPIHIGRSHNIREAAATKYYEIAGSIRNMEEAIIWASEHSFFNFYHKEIGNNFGATVFIYK
uniref:SCP domain-containing protein n=1 Tax=Strongyloides venezuelensis TaxID=75913 RepID=A0A0K0EWR8_STRVS